MTAAPTPADPPVDPSATPSVESPAEPRVESPAEPAADAVTLRPVETDTGRIVIVGTALFAVAFVVLLVARFAAPDWSDAHDEWVRIAFAGAVLGGIGWVVVGRHRRLGRTR